MGNVVEANCCQCEKEEALPVGIPLYQAYNFRAGHSEASGIVAINGMKAPTELPPVNGKLEQIAFMGNVVDYDTQDNSCSTREPSEAPSSVDFATGETNDTAPLPQGWKTLVSKTTGQTYYYNTATGESTFTKPKLEQIDIAVKKDLPTGWAESRSRTTGQVYYYNASLRKSQFEFPKA